jgi:hypothetical protein
VQYAKVSILSSLPVEKEGSFTNDKGEDVKYATRKQSARLEVQGFAYPFDVRLEKDQRPYPVGDYALDLAAMLQCNKGSISLNKFPVLVPVASAVKA